MANRTKTLIAELSVDVCEPDSGGSRGTILFSHGAWVGSWVWDGFADWFADQGFTCYVPNWRGRYDSKEVPDVGALSVYDFVEDCLAVARSVEPIVLIGESMGGLIALKAAESLPTLKALVLMNSAPPFMVPASPRVIKSQFKYLGDLLRSKPNHPNESDYKELILNNVAEPEASAIYARTCPDSGRALREMSMGKIKATPSAVACPVCVVIGHLDNILPLKAHRKVAKMYNAHVMEYPDKSHHTFSEEGWQDVAAELLIWIEEKLGSKVT